MTLLTYLKMTPLQRETLFKDCRSQWQINHPNHGWVDSSPCDASELMIQKGWQPRLVDRVVEEPMTGFELAQTIQTLGLSNGAKGLIRKWINGDQAI